MRSHLFPFILVVLLSPVAQSQQCTTEIAVNAFNSRTKNFVYGLTSADFQATIGRNQLRISSVQPVFRNRVLVLLDSGGHPDKAGMEAMAELVTEAPPGMPVAFGVFAQRAAFTRGFIKDPDALNPAVSEVMAQASTLGTGNDLPAALHQGLALFGPHEPGDTIVLVSNGGQQASKRTTGKLRKEFRRHGTRLQLLLGLLPSRSSRGNDPSALFAGWTLADNLSDDLIRLANSTGGALMGFMNSDWLHVASSGYMVSIVAPAEMTGPRRWSLRLRDTGNDVPPADLFYPEQLAPCAAPVIAAVPTQTKPRP